MTAPLIVGTVGVIAAFVTTWSFVVLYHWLTPWWRSVIGRTIMALTLAMSAVLTLSLTRIVAGADLDTPWFAWLRVSVFWAIPAVMMWLIVILIRSQRGIPSRIGAPVMTTRKLGALLVALQVIAAASNLAELTSPKVAGVFALLVAAAQAGVTAYRQPEPARRRRKPPTNGAASD